MRKSTNPNKIYESIPSAATGRNSFDKTHVKHFTGRVGTLIPCMISPVVPGDKFKIAHSLQVRFPALVVPAEVRMDAYLHTFYVPERVLWSGFDNWFQRDSGYTVPRFQVKTALSDAQDRFLDYLGIPPIGDSTAKVAMMVKAAPAAVYQKIYNDYFRPRPFEDPIDIALPDAGGTISDALRDRLLTLRQRSWEHDYFTSMLPEPMVAPDVTLGVGDVVLKDNWYTVHDARPWFVDDGKTADPDGNTWKNNDSTLVGQPGITIAAGIAPSQRVAYDPNGSLEVEASTIQALRIAYARARYLEKMGRAGGEYYEIIQALYDEKIPDSRLQRAEYVTGMKAPVIINPVLSTTQVTGSPVGQQYGHAISIGNGGGKTFNVPEHGYMMTIFSLVPKPTYKQGVPRHFRAFDQEDYIIPDLAHIGEQPVYSWEVTAYEEDVDDANGATEIGYMPNYTDKKQMQSSIAGEFRNSLQNYVVTKEYDTSGGLPTLDKAFVQIPIDVCDHIFVVASGITDPLWCTVLHAIDHEMPLPVYSEPI